MSAAAADLAEGSVSLSAQRERERESYCSQGTAKVHMRINVSDGYRLKLQGRERKWDVTNFVLQFTIPKG